MREIPAGFAQALKALRNLAPGKSGQPKLDDEDFKLGIELFYEFINWQVERPLLSLKFLKEFDEQIVREIKA